MIDDNTSIFDKESRQMNNTEAELKKRIMDAEYKIKVLEDNQKHIIDSIDTELYFLKNRLAICERVAAQIEENNL